MKKQRRIFSFVLALLLVFAFAGMSAAEVVEIGSAEELVAFGERVKAGETTLGAKLTMNIDLTGVTWKPIGTHIESGDEPVDYSYAGEFDGNGKTITGLKLTSADAALFVYSYEYEGDIKFNYYLVAGLFGVLSQDAEVRNLNIASPDIDLSDGPEGYSSAGSVAGYSAGKVESCGVQGGVISANSDAGGIVGWSVGEVTNCTASGIGSIEGYYYAGGVVGYNKGTITNSTASEIAGIEGYYAGGVAGYNFDGTITNSSASDIDSIYGECAGGVVGYNSGTIANCKASDIGTISGYQAGGIAGENEDGTITNCKASDIGTISGYQAGGVAGYNDEGTITNSKVSGIGSIEGEEVGGIAARNWSGTITNCTVSGIETISGSDDAGGVVGENNGEVTNCTVSGIGKISDEYDDAGGVVGYNGGTITNCKASDIGTISGVQTGGIAGENNDGTIANCMANGIKSVEGYEIGGITGYNNDGTITNCLLFAGAEPTVLSGDKFEGGVLGYLDYEDVPILNQVQNCLYPSNVIFENYEDKPIGNIDLEDMEDEYNVTSYDVNADADSLPAIVAMIEQGMAVMVEKGKTYELDITTLPGTQGIEDMTFTWATEDDTIVTISGNGTVVTLTGVELGAANVTCTITGGLEAELTCAVTVIEATSGGGGSSSNCGTLPGVFALFALAALPFIRKQK